LKQGLNLFLNLHFLYGGMFVNNTTENIKEEGPSACTSVLKKLFLNQASAMANTSGLEL
jgi:hypothetical protein